MKTTLFTFTLAAVTLLMFGSCTKDAPQGIFDPNYKYPGVGPTVTSIVPDGAPYFVAGITTIVINGTGFPTDTSLHLFFDNIPMTITSVTATQIKLPTPQMIKDSIRVRIRVDGAGEFSDIKYISIRSVLILVKEIDTTKQIPAAITFNKAGNLFVSLIASGSSIGIYQLSPTGTFTQFAQRAPSGGEAFFTGLKCRGDSVYAARSGNFKVIASRNSNTNFMNIFNATYPNNLPLFVSDFDYDQKLFLWIGGNNSVGGLVRIDTQRNVQNFPLTALNGIVRSVRVFNNAVYVSHESSLDAVNSVYKIPINPDNSLGTPEKYFDLSATVGNTTNKTYGITFDDQGNLYVGTDADAGIYVVAPDKSSHPLYSGLIGSSFKYLAWGKDSYLYGVREKATPTGKLTGLFKIDMLGKVSAPYYGQ